MDKIQSNEIKNNIASEFILPPMSEWENDNIKPDSKGIELILQIKQKYRDQVFMEVYERGRILHAELANHVSVSASGLNAVIKKLNEAPIKPIHETKAGKFKFYTLTEEGNKYVKFVLLPTMISDKQDEEEVHNLFNLLSVFKDKNQEVWKEKITALLDKKNTDEEETPDENTAIGCELIQALGQFYQRENNKARKLLELGIADKQIVQNIISYFNKNYVGNNVSAWATLNQWERQDCVKTYTILDELFQSIFEGEVNVENIREHFQSDELQIDRVLDKIHADVLRASCKNWSKDRLMNKWIEADMDKHLALYLAEKYRVFNENLKQLIESREDYVN